MAKTKLSLMILGSIIIFMLGVLITYFLLLATGQVNGEANEITITIVDNEKEYDGTILNAEECEVTKGTLLKGHKIEAEYYGGITDVGVGESNCNIKIVDESGKDYTKDYSITLKKGNLEVTKRPITLAIKKAGTNYDAESIIETNYDNDITDEIDYEVVSNIKLCKGHRLVPDFEVGDIQNVETLDGEDSYGETNVNMVAAIYDINGFDVTSNYAISYKDDMKVKINKPALTLTTLSYTKEYDGEPFDEDEISYNLKGELPKNYSIDVKYVNNINDIVNVDDSGLLVVDTRNTKITDEKGNDVTSNYKILAQNVGSLNITPVKLHLHVDDYSVEYDGEEHYFDTFSIIDDEKINSINTGAATTGFMLNGYQYDIDVLPKTIMTDVGSKTNNLAFEINLENSTSNEDLSSNFMIVYDSSPVISITRANLTIVTQEYSVEYTSDSDFDYESLIQNDAIVTGVLNNGVDFESKFSIDYTPIVPLINGGGKYDVVLSNIRITRKASTDAITSNFNIYTSPLVLNVKKLVINAKSNSSTWEYDAEPHSSEDEQFEWFDSNGIKLDENIYHVEVSSRESITDVGSKTNTFAITLNRYDDENGGYKNITDDIGINYTYGTLTVYRAIITATSEDYEGTYTGEAQKADDSSFTVGNFDSSKYTIINKASITNVSESGKQNTFTVSFGEGINPANYEISYVYGTMTLKPIVVTATSGDYEGTYDGTAQSDSNDNFEVSNIGSNTYTIIDKTTITNVSESGKQNSFKVSITGANSMNYEINYTYGKMTLNPKTVTAISGDYEGTYDGNAQSAPDSLFSITGIVSSYTISEKATITNVGESGKQNTFIISGIIVDNYDIKYTCGTMKLNKKIINASSGDYTGTYDGKIQSAPNSLFSVIGISSYTISEKATITNVSESGKQNTFTISGIDGDNYQINYTCGTMTLNPKIVTAISGNYVGTYDGNPHEADDFSFTVTGLSDYTIIDKATITNVNESGKNNSFAITITGSEDNYDISYVFGTMTLNKKEVRATSGNYVGTYDGTEKSAPTSSFSVSGLSTYTIVDKATITNVSESGKLNTFKIEGVDENNYDINYSYGTMTLNKKIVRATSGNYVGTYDGNQHEADDSSFTVTGLSDYTITDKATITNVSESGKLNSFTIFGIDEENYDVNYTYGTMSLEKATLYVKWKNINSGNLEDHSITDIDCDVTSSNNIIPSYLVTSGSISAPNTPLSVSVSYSWTISISGEDALNYNIVYISGIITFAARNSS